MVWKCNMRILNILSGSGVNLIGKMCEQKIEVGKGLHHVVNWVTHAPIRRTNQWKAPKVRMYLMSSSKTQEDSMAGTERAGRKNGRHWGYRVKGLRGLVAWSIQSYC